MIISRSKFLKIRNVAEEGCIENKNSRPYLIYFFLNRVVCEIMWKNIVEWSRTQMTIWRMLIACSITKATDTNSEYVILLLHSNNCCKKAPHCYITPTRPVLSRTKVTVSSQINTKHINAASVGRMQNF